MLEFLNAAEVEVLGPHDDLHRIRNPLPVLADSIVGLVPQTSHDVGRHGVGPNSD
jgi:hypothetical protein